MQINTSHLRLASAISFVGIAILQLHVHADAAEIFRCTVDGVATFSDRPCGEQARAYTPDDSRFSTFAAPPIPKNPVTVRKTKDKPAKVAAVSIAAAQAQHAQRCSQMASRLRDIRSQMRAGYDVKQGERLRERQRKLTQRHRQERC